MTTTSLPSSYLELTRMERLYVDARLEGLSQVASATAAGAAQPRTEGNRLEKNPKVQKAIIDRMEKVADEVDFSRKEAHDMYMEAYRNAETAMEQIAAVNSMVKLHGLEKPKVVEHQHQHTHSGQLEYMPTEELLKLAEMEDLVLEGEFEVLEETPALAAPKVTEDNSLEEPKPLPTVSEDY